MKKAQIEVGGSLWLASGGKDGAAAGHGRIALLRAIDAHGSISAAAREMGMSYKAAWDAIDAINNLAGTPLVVRETGGKGGGQSSGTTGPVAVRPTKSTSTRACVSDEILRSASGSNRSAVARSPAT